MKIILATMIVLLRVNLSAQTEMNYSYEMKYGDGKQVTIQDTADYFFFENLLDLNTYLGDNIYVFTQFEYSDPPVFGHPADGLNTFYLEYQTDEFNLKLGDLYELYGRGLSFYTLQDQNIDYDNSIKGLTLNYSLKENLEISTLIGKGDYSYRSNPSFRKSDHQFSSSVFLGAVNYENDFLGYLQMVHIRQHSIVNPALTGIFEDKTDIFDDLDERLETDSGLQAIYLDYILGNAVIDTVQSDNFNFNWNMFAGPFDIYIDKSWINYNKIFGQDAFGTRFYSSIYMEFFGTGITYEYKNYFTPYLIKSISNPPIVYREGNSILASRNVHSINFGNEIGHQIDINRILFSNINVAANLSLSRQHQMDSMKSISLIDIVSMKDEIKMYDYNPFRQIYLELNGWALSEKLYYKVGMDHFTEFYDGKNTSALTIPSQWAWKLPNGSSITMYLETQEKIIKRITPGEYTNHYSSVSYSHLGKWIITGFYDKEIKEAKSNEWLGADLSYELNTTTQISLFYGSQKGGLICANGICAEQPGFEDGIKITFRSLF